MGRRFVTNFKEEPTLTSRMEKWIRGLNLLVSNTQIRPDELSEAQDIQLVEDGKVQCPRDGQAYFGSESGSRVTGLFPFYKSDGTRKLLRMSGTTLQEYDGADWDNVSGFTYTTTLNTEGVMAYDRLYLCNGTDALTYYDGSSITSFTAISAPSAPTATRTGSSGSYTFSYKITAVTAVGETTGSTAGSTTLNQSVLDTSNYMTVTWSTVTNAIGYNVYGRKDGDWRFITYVEGNSSTTYVDKGTVTPSTTFTPPEGNSTGGQKGKYVALYKDSLFLAGDPANPSRLYYSGGGDKVHDFTVGSGGGFIDISKNDGQVITGLIVFKNSLIVFKEDSIYQFSFTTDGLPQVVLVNPSVGAIAPRSIIGVENDVFFMSRRGVFTIGNEAGFAFDVLRTNELSSRVRSVVSTIDPAYVQNVSAIYVSDSTKNLAIFAYTPSGSATNSKALVYDRERLGWVKWSNIQANCWTTYRGTDGVTHFLYGDDASGYVKEILSGSTDFGSSIRGYYRIKAEHFKELDRYKKLKDVNVVLRRPSGTIRLNIIKDGVDTVYTSNIGTISPTVNFGHYTFTDFLFGESTGSGVSSQDENVLRTIRNVNLEGRSFMLEFDNQGATANFTLLLASMTAKARSIRYRKSGEVVGSDPSSSSGTDQVEDLLLE